MRAIVLESVGQPMVMRERPLPTVRAGEVRVRVAVSGSIRSTSSAGEKPSALSMREAAALPPVFITAWEGQRVLIRGGAGSVRNMCAQLAVAFGATTFATGSAKDRERIAVSGATPIDRALPLEEYVAARTGGNGFDIVYDTVGGAVLDASFKAARTHSGHVVSCLGWGTYDLAPLSFRAATYSGVEIGPHGPR